MKRRYVLRKTRDKTAAPMPAELVERLKKVTGEAVEGDGIRRSGEAAAPGAGVGHGGTRQSKEDGVFGGDDAAAADHYLFVRDRWARTEECHYAILPPRWVTTFFAMRGTATDVQPDVEFAL